MKKYMLVLICSLGILACKKQSSADAPPPVRNDHKELLANVNAYLKKELLPYDLATVDPATIILSEQGGVYYIRVPLLNRKIETDFILLQADSLGHCSTGKFVHIQRDTTLRSLFNGQIVLESLRHGDGIIKRFTNSKVTKQYRATNPSLAIQENSIEVDDIIPSCDDCLPLVVVVGVRDPYGGTSFCDMISLSGILGSSPAVSVGSSDPVTGGGGAGQGAAATSSPAASSGIYSPISLPPNAGGMTVKISSDLRVNFETSYTKPGIDVNSFMKCFATIPDAGATCSVTIYTDLPVDDNPDYIFNILSGATGHCFLQLTKTNAMQSVTQIIGKTTSKALAILAFPVPGKIVDNGAHKYNASLTMSITPAQLQTEINAAVSMGNTPQYDIWENNCVDYAIAILNKIRPTNPLSAVPFTDPDTGDHYNTPQGLYLALDQIKKNGGVEAKNIITNIISRATTSHGPCN